jgi:hypothetical protein
MSYRTGETRLIARPGLGWAFSIKTAAQLRRGGEQLPTGEPWSVSMSEPMVVAIRDKMP